MSSFKVSIVNGVLNILCEDEVPETDIIDLLEFDENQLEDLYRNHAAIQARWEQISINLQNQYDSFEEDFVKKWWAYNKRYAKLVLDGYKENKPTIDTIKDMVILIYSSDTSELEREKYGNIAYNAAILKDASYKDSKDVFLKDMFKHINGEVKWYFETVVNTLKNLERNLLTVKNIAKRLDNRSYHMKELKDLMMAKHGNQGPMTEREKDHEQRAIRNISGYAPKGE